jgi:transcriptional regulator with XRE-family HTH domain
MAGLSQPELSRRSGVVQPTISQLETGKIRHPRFDTSSRIKRVLGVTDDEFKAALAESIRQCRTRSDRRRGTAA